MRSKFAIVALAALLLVAGSAWAEGPTARQIIDKVQARYAKTKDIKARFEQATVLPGGRRLEAAGQAYFKKPNMIRWDFTRPEAESIITNGQTMWIYEPAAHQVQVYSAGLLDPRLQMGFFSDLRRLEDDFDISAGKPTACCWVLDLAPKPGRGVDLRHLTLLVARDTLRVVQATSADMAGNDTTVRFVDMKENTGLKDSLFNFTPPPGTQVIQPAGAGVGSADRQ